MSWGTKHFIKLTLDVLVYQILDPVSLQAESSQLNFKVTIGTSQSKLKSPISNSCLSIITHGGDLLLGLRHNLV